MKLFINYNTQVPKHLYITNYLKIKGYLDKIRLPAQKQLVTNLFLWLT